ncbi:hypothetical protein V6N13_079659 [Hibiscus sabdariffa]|uniref:Nuclear shuttle protein n=1 Tax=Hibiscus sabdariffa TaxID=183260 RepID=A0ABR2RST4_9ROSI
MAYKRGYYAVRRFRRRYNFNSRSYFKRTSGQVRRSLFNARPLTERLSLQTIHENQYGPEYSIPNNGSLATYITYPGIGQLEPNRHRSFIKLNRLRFNGTASIHANHGDEVMDPESPTPVAKINGVLTVAIVLDRKPQIAPGTSNLDRFEDVFGAAGFTHGNLEVIPRVKDRFSLKHTFKRVISVDKDSILVRIGGEFKLSSARYPCWAGFKDLGMDFLGGNYSNLSKNALLVFYCWMSDNPSKANLFVSFDLDYLG